MTMAIDPGTDGAGYERTTFRLNARQIDAIEFVARGELEGESGVKSITALGGDVQAGVAKSSALAMHQAELVSDEDELFNKIGDYLANGFTHAEIANIVSHDAGEVHLLAIERWVARVGLTCFPDEEPVRWSVGGRHANHGHARRTFDMLRRERQGQAANVLFTVYGWADPFVATLPHDMQEAFGREYGALARYTDTVEGKRQELAKAEASLHSGDEVVDLERWRVAYRFAERCLSSTDAVRSAVELPRGRRDDESKKQYDERIAAAKLARDQFISAVRIDANRMLSEASRLFEDAWRRS